MCRIYQHLILTCGCRIDQSLVPLYIEFCGTGSKPPLAIRRRSHSSKRPSPKICASPTLDLALDLRLDKPAQPFNGLEITCIEHKLATESGDDPREIEPISYPCFHAFSRKVHDFHASPDLESLVKGMGWKRVGGEYRHAGRERHHHVCPVECGYLRVDEVAEDEWDADPGDLGKVGSGEGRR